MDLANSGLLAVRRTPSCASVNCYDEGRDVSPQALRDVVDAQLRQAQAQLERLEAEYGVEAFANLEQQRRTMRGFKIAQGKLGQRICRAWERVEQLQQRRAAVPPRVPVGNLTAEPVVKLAPERKQLTKCSRSWPIRRRATCCAWSHPTAGERMMRAEHSSNPTWPSRRIWKSPRRSCASRWHPRAHSIAPARSPRSAKNSIAPKPAFRARSYACATRCGRPPEAKKRTFSHHTMSGYGFAVFRLGWGVH